MKAPSAANPSSLQSPTPAPVPVRSPRTSIILAELARQRRLERRHRRLKRLQRRRAWARVATWLAGLITPRAQRFGGHSDRVHTADRQATATTAEVRMPQAEKCHE